MHLTSESTASGSVSWRLADASVALPVLLVNWAVRLLEITNGAGILRRGKIVRGLQGLVCPLLPSQQRRNLGIQLNTK